MTGLHATPRTSGIPLPMGNGRNRNINGRHMIHTPRMLRTTQATWRATRVCSPGLATLPTRATRRLLPSGRCFAAHDTCCFMRHGCRFHCADPRPSVAILSDFREVIATLGQGLRRVNSPRPVSPSGSSTRSALHDLLATCTSLHTASDHGSMLQFPFNSERPSGT